MWYKASVLLAIAVAPPTVLTQESPRSTLVALVADRVTGAPLEGAEVVIISLRRMGRSDGEGRSQISGIPWGTHRVRVRRLGRVAQDMEISFVGDSVKRVFLLAPVASEIETVTVVAVVPEFLQGFEQRRRMAIGRFLTEKDLVGEASREFASVMVSRFPGLREIRSPTARSALASSRGNCGAGTAGPPMPALPGRQSRAPTAEPTGAQSRSTSSCFAGQPCLLQVFLDDLKLDVTEFDIVRTWDLAAVEYYTGTSMPARYRVDGSACGVLVLWSKR